MWIALATAIGVVIYLFGLFGYLTAYGPHLSVVQSMFKLYGYEEWQHCVLVPFLCLFLAWTKRKALATALPKPSFLGLLVAIPAFACFWLSYRLDDIYFAFISLQLLAAALILLFGGWTWMKILFFPWLFLAFAWPLFFLDNLIAFPLRVVMSTLSTFVLNTIGIASVQVGTSIQSAPNPINGLPAGEQFQVDVADPCSGMRSLFALMMVTALYGFFTMKTWWKHAILFLSAIPLAIVGNLIRILMLTIGILLFGNDVAIGTLEDPSFYHMLSGFVVFGAALGGMLIIAAILQGNYRHWFNNLKGPGSPQASSPSSTHPVDSSQTAPDLY